MATFFEDTISNIPVVLPRGGEWNNLLTFPVPTGLGTGSGTVSAVTQPFLDTLRVKLRFTKDASAGSGTGLVTFPMPAGYTIDTTTNKLTTIKYIGVGSYTNTGYGPENDVVVVNSTSFAIRKNGTATNMTGADFAASSDLNLYLEIPIVEWAGGYLSYGQGLATSVKPGLISNFETGTFTVTYSGAVGPGSTTVAYQKVGRQVTLQFPSMVTGSAGVAQANYTGLPANLRPATDLYFNVIVADAGSAQSTPGFLTIGNSSVMVVARTVSSVNFTNTGNQGMYQAAVTYLAAS